MSSSGPSLFLSEWRRNIPFSVGRKALFIASTVATMIRERDFSCEMFAFLVIPNVARDFGHPSDPRKLPPPRHKQSDTRLFTQFFSKYVENCNHMEPLNNLLWKYIENRLRVIQNHYRRVGLRASPRAGHQSKVNLLFTPHIQAGAQHQYHVTLHVY